MRLKSLELVGFKSFPDRTIINFEEGVTGVVGPNGCGKSNIVDAIRWVMGEQSAKHLRGNNMGDVIFNGTESRPPMGMASIFLTFDNSDGRAPAEYADYTEIMIGRRLYRSGESEYFINKTPCRLKDITDLFWGTGVGTRAYAIVEQGMIGQILSAKPEDRRMLIEEAAGISKFKVRKEAALRKMESTRMNLARLNDILTELERQINSLHRQAKKAERFKTYTDELKGLELTVSAHQYRELKESLDELQKNLNLLREVEVADGSKLSAEEADIESARINMDGLEKELDEIQSLLYERQNEVQLVEAEVSYKSRDAENLAVQINRLTTEIAELEDRIILWREELSSANSEMVLADISTNSAEEDLSGIDGDLEVLRDEHHRLVVDLEDRRRNVVEYIEQVSSSSTHFEQMKRRDAELTGWIAKDQAEIDNIDARISELRNQAGSRSGEVSGTKQLRLGLEKEQGAAYETLNMQKDELKKVEDRVGSLKEEVQTKRSRLASLEELHKNYEGYQEGVRAVLKRREDVLDFQGIVGTINEIVETMPEYETAVGAVLGEKLQYVVVKSHEVGIEAIDYLKAEVSGRSTFVPIELRSEDSEEPALSGEGVIGPLLDHVSYTDDYKKVVHYLFKDVVLVEDLRKALSLWSDNHMTRTLVTLDGDVVDPAGIVSGGVGGDSSKQLMAHRREMKELATSISHLSAELGLEESMLGKLRKRVKGLEESISRLGQEAHSEEIKLINQEKDLHHLEQEINYYGAQRDKLTLGVAAFAEEQLVVQKEIVNTKERFERACREKAELEQVLSEDQQRETDIRNKVQDLVHKKTELNLQIETGRDKILGFGKEMDRLLSSIAETCAGIAFRNLEIISATHTIKASNFSVESKRKYLHFVIQMIDELKQKYTDIKTRYDSDLLGVREREAAVRGLRKRHDEHVKNMHELDLASTQRRERQSYLVREIFDKYRVSLDHSYEKYLVEDIELEKSSERVNKLKEKIEGIGAVNVDAIGEYDELKVRYDFLQEQHADLTASMEDLQKAIQKINRTSKIRFQEAFNSVNERFQKLFPKLFEGGKAELVLADEENALESGVDIIAQPPGKKLQSVTLLSGGEKALTAVALIFAMFLHRPSPFCLLDEVDAPLDDANIDRFNDMIREMTKLSQFILITHNKRTMELADILYGVTMEERGASKVISLSLIDRKKEEQAA